MHSVCDYVGVCDNVCVKVANSAVEFAADVHLGHSGTLAAQAVAAKRRRAGELQ